jgi:murein tripeptide amidase MpaA
VPNLCALESIGKSYEGRDIWLVTVTNTETGAHLDKPGFLIEANIHSIEWTGSTAALHLVHRLLAGHGKDDLVTRALDTRVFYVIPRLNPDGAERGLEERRFIRSSVRPYPREDHEDGLRVEDIDGDGRVLDMRVEDPNGAWRPHPEERKLLIRREPIDSPADGPFYRLLAEGRIENYDGVTVEVELPDGARLVGGEVKTEAGPLKGRADKRSTTWWANDESTCDLAKLEWVVEAPAGAEIAIEARHSRAGTVRRTITLE